MRVYERGSERWEIELRDSSLHQRSILGGVAIGESVETYATVVQAKWEMDRVCLAQVGVGFARVGDLEASPNVGEGDFIEALVSDPDDVPSTLVFADWLADRGDSWGELINVHHARAGLARLGAEEQRDLLDREHARIVFADASRFWGRLGEIVVNESTQSYAFDCISANWQMGFIRDAAVELNPRREHLLLRELIAAFAPLPVMQLLDQLAINIDGSECGDLSAIAEQRWPCLRTLVVSNDSRSGRRGAAIDANVFRPILVGHCAPRLARIDIHGIENAVALCRAIEDGEQAARLKSIRVRGTGWNRAAVAALLRASLADLEELVLLGAGLPTDAAQQLAGLAPKVRVTGNP